MKKYRFKPVNRMIARLMEDKIQYTGYRIREEMSISRMVYPQLFGDCPAKSQ
jgi:hypothetical protein